MWTYLSLWVCVCLTVGLPSVCSFIYLSLRPFVCSSNVCLSAMLTHLSIFSSIRLSVSLDLRTSFHLPVCPSFHLLAHASLSHNPLLYICLPSVHPSVRLSVRQSVRPSVYLFYRPTMANPFIFPSVCPSISDSKVKLLIPDPSCGLSWIYFSV
jgi:hypothetical protein